MRLLWVGKNPLLNVIFFILTLYLPPPRHPKRGVGVIFLLRVPIILLSYYLKKYPSTLSGVSGVDVIK